MRLDTLFDNSARVPMTFLSNGGCPVRLMSVELDHPAALAPAPFRRRAGIPMTEIAVTAGENFGFRSEEHTSELQSLMRISYAVFCLKKKKKQLTKSTIT